jgi:hypothetical protein
MGEFVISPKLRAAIDLHVRKVRQRIKREVERLFAQPADRKVMSFVIAWEGSLGYFRNGKKTYSPIIAFKVNRPSCKPLEYLARVTGGTYTRYLSDKDMIGRPRCCFRTVGERTFQILKRIPPIPNEEKERRRQCILKTWRGYNLTVKPLGG